MNTMKFGRWLVYAGVAGFGIAAAQSFTVWSGLDRGAVPAASIFLVMVGMCFAFPSLLEEGVGRVSTMRIGVLAIILVFVVTTVKQGWVAGQLASTGPLSIDEHWIYILGLALGSKAAQKIVESRGSNVDAAVNADAPAAAADAAGSTSLNPAAIFTSAPGVMPSVSTSSVVAGGVPSGYGLNGSAQSAEASSVAHG